jgi:phosphatidylglycerol:prolipoprotein diacylglycerol transferase
MHPVLVRLPFIEIDSYYVLWILALFIFLKWTRKRAVCNGYTEDEAVSVLMWVYVCGVAGALIFGVLERLPQVLQSGTIYEAIQNSGMSSGGGLLCGGVGGIYKIKRLNRSVNDFAESAAPPMAALLAVGRIGCFLEGCCSGIGAFYAERPFWGVRFPSDPAGFFRYPSQISESVASFLILTILIITEKKIKPRLVDSGRSGSILLPVFLILYGSYRLIFDRFRVLEAGAVFRAGWALSAVALAVGGLWLIYTLAFSARRS